MKNTELKKGNIDNRNMSFVDKYQRDIHIEKSRKGREIYVLNRGKLGRKKGTKETVQTFLNKPKSKQIIKHLSIGESVRNISYLLNVSVPTIYKVKNNLTFNHN